MDLPEHWTILERAADSTWPTADPNPPPFSRADWDKIFGTYDAITDVGSAFAVELSRAYPEAKVVVVRRDPRRWEPSFESQIVAPVWGPLANFLFWVILPILGNRGLAAMRKILLGLWNVRNQSELKEKAVPGHEAYYERVRAEVPEHRRLEYQLGSGWEPLCSFLELPAPDVSFPWVIEAAEHKRKQKEQVDQVMRTAWVKLRPWLAPAAVAAVGTLAWIYYG
ncbi:hypothetical protein GGR57DRAFT_234628 [Xylariaceae sp. FL1272]|nr:hypothetical protein GGR57DRAFT_234628 [Xylariaceae sp. FL1272]